MPTLQMTAKPVHNQISLSIPSEYEGYSFEVILVPFKEEKPAYDFSDLIGKLNWKGDAVAEQRRLRDEW